MPTPHREHAAPERTIEVRVAPASNPTVEATHGDDVPPGWEPFVDWFCAYWIRCINRGMDERR
jgi:hypothetical protein